VDAESPSRKWAVLSVYVGDRLFLEGDNSRLPAKAVSKMHDLNDTYYFAKLVELGGLSAASSELGVAKSVLSRSLARLEAALGVKLIHRTTRRMSATNVGSRYYQQCRVVLAELDRASRVVEDAREIPRGRLRITCPVNFAQLGLARILATFSAKYPEIEIHIDLTNGEVDLLQGRYDLCIRVAPRLRSTDLITRAFSVAPHILFASPSLLARHEIPKDPAQLTAFPSASWSMPEGRGGKHCWELTHHDGAQRSVKHRPRLVTEDLYILKEAALSGNAVADLPPLFCHTEVSDGNLVRLLPDWEIPVKLHLLYGSRRATTRALNAFVEHLAAYLPPLISVSRSGSFQEFLRFAGGRA
jgi:DNA-binding transcriptional LysR family regulator